MVFPNYRNFPRPIFSISSFFLWGGGPFLGSQVVCLFVCLLVGCLFVGWLFVGWLFVGWLFGCLLLHVVGIVAAIQCSCSSSRV